MPPANHFDLTDYAVMEEPAVSGGARSVRRLNPQLGNQHTGGRNQQDDYSELQSICHLECCDALNVSC